MRLTSAADLPDDIDALKAMLLAAEAQIAVQNESLVERDGIIERKEDRIIRLEKLLSDFKRALYGAKSEGARYSDLRLLSVIKPGARYSDLRLLSVIKPLALERKKHDETL